MVKKAKKTIKEAEKDYTGAVLKTIMVIFIIIALFLAIKYLFYGEKEDITNKLIIEDYKNYTFVKTNNTWIFNYKGKSGIVYTQPMYYFPGEVSDVPVYNVTQIQIHENSKYYITLDEMLTPKSVVAGIEIAKIFGKGDAGILKMDIESALAYDAGYDTGRPIITCKNATFETGVIFLTLGEYTHIKRQENCIILMAENENDMTKLANRLDYIALGIMK